jgi:hypothetical protein
MAFPLTSSQAFPSEMESNYLQPIDQPGRLQAAYADTLRPLMAGYLKR